VSTKQLFDDEVTPSIQDVEEKIKSTIQDKKERLDESVLQLDLNGKLKKGETPVTTHHQPKPSL